MKENYMEKLDAWLNELLTGAGPQAGETPDEWLARVKKAIKDKVLESFRNGQRSKRSGSDSEPRKRVQK